MKQVYRLSLLMLAALLLSACGGATTSTTSTSLNAVYTAVAATLTSQVGVPATATETPLPTDTLPPTSTLYPSATTVPATATAQIVYSYSGTNYGCEDSTYVKDMTIPDGTVLTPGESFVKTWKLQNTGSCTWTDTFSIVFVSGDDMDGSDTEIAQTVYLNKKGEISVSLIAPEDEGTYTGYWRMADQYGNVFGETVSVEIEVAEPTATSTATTTATATPTLSPTNTPTSTSISTSTATSLPSSTPTATAIDTPTDVPSETATAVPAIVPTDTPLPPSPTEVQPTATPTS